MLNKLPKSLHFRHTKISAYHEQDLNKLSKNRFKDTYKWSTKRKHEFFSGRICAAQCLQLLGSSEIDVLISADRSPVWPNNFIGSISHSNFYASAIVGVKTEYKAIGLDIQPTSSSHIAKELKNIILTSNELNHFWNKQNYNDVFDLIFSAKETLFKALHPVCKVYFDHQDAEVTDIQPEKQELTIKLLTSLGSHYMKDTEFTIHFQKIEGELVSWMFIS